MDKPALIALINEWKEEQEQIQDELREGASNPAHQAELSAKDESLQRCISDLERLL